MINFSFAPNFLLGFLVSICALILYFLRNIRPEMARDEDVFFSTMGLLYGIILIILGWRLDPILLFSQSLVILVLLFTGWENIRLRGCIVNLLEAKKKTENQN